MKKLKISSIDDIDLEAAIHTTVHNSPLGCIVQAHGITVDMDERVPPRFVRKYTLRKLI